MPRKPRFFLPGLAAHVVQRGNNRQPIFFERSDYERYLSLLGDGCDRYSCVIHAYALMTNHVHLLLTPAESQSVSRMMQYLGRHYVPYVNHKYSRSGTLWEGRFKASLVDTSSYLLACYRYIESNPVRAGMVANAGDYRWSSFHHNGLGLSNPLIAPHAEYENLGVTLQQRRASYRLLFEHPEEEGLLVSLREHMQSGTPLGSERLRDDIETGLATRIGKSERGRPRKRALEKGL
jgi:putative transposase